MKTFNERNKKIICLALCLLTAAFALCACAAADVSGDGIDPSYFFPADPDEDILSDGVYLALDRRIMFESYGETLELNASTAEYKGPAAKMFLDYMNCVITGAYEDYPSFFTRDYLTAHRSEMPGEFTMQKVYDINIKLFTVADRSADGGLTEIYEVKYRIFENNGTFRRDIKSMETRTLIFEVITDGSGKALINSIGTRSDG